MSTGNDIANGVAGEIDSGYCRALVYCHKDLSRCLGLENGKNTVGTALLGLTEEPVTNFR